MPVPEMHALTTILKILLPLHQLFDGLMGNVHMMVILYIPLDAIPVMALLRVIVWWLEILRDEVVKDYIGIAKASAKGVVECNEVEVVGLSERRPKVKGSGLDEVTACGQGVKLPPCDNEQLVSEAVGRSDNHPTATAFAALGEKQMLFETAYDHITILNRTIEALGRTSDSLLSIIQTQGKSASKQRKAIQKARKSAEKDSTILYWLDKLATHPCVDFEERVGYQEQMPAVSQERDGNVAARRQMQSRRQALLEDRSGVYAQREEVDGRMKDVVAEKAGVVEGVEECLRSMREVVDGLGEMMKEM